MCLIYARVFPILFSLVLSNGVQAQSCSYFPADCPSDRQLPDSADRLTNPIIPSEIDMELSLREFFTGLMQNLAAGKGWEVYRFDETAGSGYLNSNRSGPLAADFRPPHEYEISFIFIVNQDSLRAWQQWNKNFEENMMAEVEKMKSSSDFSAITNIQDTKKNNMERFRNSSMIRVKFDINPGDATVSSITENVHQTALLNVPNAVLALQVHNNKMDERAIFDLDQFSRCSDLAFVLFGNWNIKPDVNQYYRPAYNADKKNTDLVTPKSLASTKVRIIAMHVEGSPAYMKQFLQSLDTEKLSGIIVR
jgi:hypothetical protein